MTTEPLTREMCWIPAADVLPMGPHDVFVTDGEELWIGHYYNGEWYKSERDDPVADMTTIMKTNGQALLVTTEHRGVFFGYGAPTTDKTIRLTQSRMCVYWSTDAKGIVGLAATGPTKSCRVTAAAPAITLQGVTSIMEVSDEAAEKWEKSPWAQ